MDKITVVGLVILGFFALLGILWTWGFIMDWASGVRNPDEIDDHFKM